MVTAGEFMVTAGEFMVTAGEFMVTAGEFMVTADELFSVSPLQHPLCCAPQKLRSTLADLIIPLPPPLYPGEEQH
jgi:hypothetical protein